ncbi:MAG TPA: hypothetical protein VFE30_12305 [Anaeromyxobacteraceae bacterium]|jgi:hypothetical protein|nr:hypothetical protein [Anaeromyxobacteraceae bacterium]
MSPRILTGLVAGALGLTGCAHENAGSPDRASEQARAAAGPTTGSPGDPQAPNQAASVRPQASPRAAMPPSMTGTGSSRTSPQQPALEPVTEEPASPETNPPAPAAPATPK